MRLRKLSTKVFSFLQNEVKKCFCESTTAFQRVTIRSRETTMPGERPGGDARFDESDSDGEFEGFTEADIETSGERFRNRQLSADFIRDSDDDFDVSDISSLDSGSDADVDDNDDAIRAKPWTTTLENPPDIPFATAVLGVVNSVFCSSLSAVELFMLFFTEYILREIVTETNTYAGQCMNKEPRIEGQRFADWNPLTIPELKTWLGLLLAMGLVQKKGRVAEYWSTHWLTKTPGFNSPADAFSTSCASSTLLTTKMRLLTRATNFGRSVTCWHIWTNDSLGRTTLVESCRLTRRCSSSKVGYQSNSTSKSNPWNGASNCSQSLKQRPDMCWTFFRIWGNVRIRPLARRCRWSLMLARAIYSKDTISSRTITTQALSWWWHSRNETLCCVALWIRTASAFLVT